MMLKIIRFMFLYIFIQFLIKFMMSKSFVVANDDEL